MHSRMMAGYAESNASLFRRLGVPLGDPAAWIEIGEESIALVRDLEMDRVRQRSQAATVTCPAGHPPPGGLSPDRETATAQAAARLLSSRQVAQVTVDRSLPFVFAWHLTQAGIRLDYDPEYGVRDRRSKTPEEIASLRHAQAVTEEVMRTLCEAIATAAVDDQGRLIRDGGLLTSESVRREAAVAFLGRGFVMPHGAIVATAPEVADCHHAGRGPLRSGVPVIIDLFPRDEQSRYWGDCTRTVVHGTVSEGVRRMHAAVIEAKAAAIGQLCPGITAEQVHRAAESVLVNHGYAVRRGEISDEPSIQHGTGHGIGLDVHEPILLDEGGEEIAVGEVLTVEPGLYGRSHGGVRVEDMVVATAEGPENLNRLPEGLDWKP